MQYRVPGLTEVRDNSLLATAAKKTHRTMTDSAFPLLAMHTAVQARGYLCLSVCLSVRPSHSGVLSRRMNGITPSECVKVRHFPVDSENLTNNQP